MPRPVRLSVLPATDVGSQKAGAAASRFIRERFPDTALRQDLGPPAPDLAVVIGEDRHLLRTLREMPAETAVLAVGQGFLSEVSSEGLADALRRLLQGEHWIENRTRLTARVGAKAFSPALNEIALTAGRGGGFLRHTLEVDGEPLWRDGGDGVVIATPTGSTGYGLS